MDERAGSGLRVVLDDSGPIPLITCTASEPIPPGVADRFVLAAATELLVGILNPRHTDWLPRNITRALALAGRTALGWSAAEAPVVWGDTQDDSVFAAAGAERVPYSWLRADLDNGELGVAIYQDNGLFGLQFSDDPSWVIADWDDGYYRPHPQAPLPTGPVESVEVVLDNSIVDENQEAAVLSETTFHVGGESVLLIAAEADDLGVWQRYDESVVVLRDPSAADRLVWNPPRPARASG